MPPGRAVALALLLAVVASPLAQAQAGTPAHGVAAEDAGTYPPGVIRVGRSALRAGEEFEVEATTDDPTIASAVVTVCRFASPDAEGPEVCYMNLEASRTGNRFEADTGAAPHPAWEAGWVMGYKLAFTKGEAELHAPTSEGYYLGVVEGPADDEDRGAPLGLVAFLAIAVAASLRRR